MANKHSMKSVSLIDEISNDICFEKGSSILLNESLNNRVMINFIDYINCFFNNINIFGSNISLSDLKLFEKVYNSNPAKEGMKQSRYNTLLWLFVFCRYLNPNMIVESGVYMGRSIWVLRKSMPNSKIYGFDLNFKHLKFEDKSIDFIENDWSVSNIEANSENDFCFFDDHINNCLRIKQAYERGFKHIVFDDSPSIKNLYKYRYPGIPTAQMLLDDTLKEGDEILWKWDEKVLKYIFRESHTYFVNDIIEKIVVLPDIDKYTGINEISDLVYVKLK